MAEMIIYLALGVALGSLGGLIALFAKEFDEERQRRREYDKAMLKWIKRELELKQEAEQEAVNQSLEKIDRLK